MEMTTMTTAREYLDRYNALATEMGRPTLKGPWKSSTTAIQVRFNALSNEYNELKAFEARQAKAKEVVNAVTLACIARHVGIAPKDARAKARRHRELFGSYEIAKHEYPFKDRDAIIELLTRDHRKA
jgi:hypothetical protein